jgi:nitrous oxidase accessory protein NosD
MSNSIRIGGLIVGVVVGLPGLYATRSGTSYAPVLAGAEKANRPVVVSSTGPPVGALNVREFGALGDGDTDDRQAILTALGAVKDRGTLYFPPGRYRVSDKITITRSHLRLMGAGRQSRILMPKASDCFQLGDRQVMGPVTVERLSFVGLRVWDKSRNHYKALILAGARGCLVRDCVFEGAGVGVHDADPTRGTQIRRCRFVDWGTVGVFLNGGAHVSDCRFEQNDPNLKGEKTSHGLYIHSGATDVTVEGCSIVGARKYGIQVYGEQKGTEIARVRIVNNVFKRNASHFIVGGTPQGPTIRDIRIENNRFSHSDGTSVFLKKGSGILFRNNQIVDAGSIGIQVGVWAPYEPGMRLQGVRIEGNKIDWTAGRKRSAGQYGIWVLGQRGDLRDLSLLDNTIGGFSENEYPGGGIVLDQVQGAQIRGNRVNMPEFAGRAGSCTGIWITHSSAVEVAGNQIRIPENPNAVALRLEPGNQGLTADRNTTWRGKRGSSG